VSLCTEYFIHRNVDERGPGLPSRSPRPKDGPAPGYFHSMDRIFSLCLGVALIEGFGCK
jgi:hypothetical protein